MLYKTKGIFLKKIKYGDTSFITTIYTKEFGLKTYIVRGITSKRNKKLAFFQSLSLLDLLVYNKPNKNLQHIKEIQKAYAFTHIPTDIKKMSILLFLNEIIYHTIKEEEKNEPLFQFLFNSIIHLDQSEKSSTYFHLIFLLQLSQYLGVGPQNNFDKQSVYFDIRDACFISHQTDPAYVMDKKLSIKLHELMTQIKTSGIDIQLDYDERKKLLDWILKYYQIHIHGFPEIKSLSVLQSVFE